MFDHHQRALDAALNRLRIADDALLILLDGSVARGEAREGSDVDLIVVVTDAGYESRLQRGEVAFYWPDLADWPGGYVEGRYISKSFVKAAARDGSEPTRFSFSHVRIVWGGDSEIEAIVSQIPVYPEWDRERRMDAFFSQMWIAWHYYWQVGEERQDPFLRSLGATHIVLFGARLLLAHDRILVPSQKRLMEIVAKSPSRPEGFEALVVDTLAGERSSAERLCNVITNVVGKREVDFISRFQQDTEMSWFTKIHDVAEW